jgi:3-isopropylmalate/(R)-2-methylmalate dehydratase small subunit
MKKITNVTGLAIPLDMNDVDTDLIIPAQHLTSISREGYGKNLFIRLKQSDPNFVFNKPEFAAATILISGQNFGCGSSREHAVWALQEAGIQAVIAVSFGDIFFNNSGKNGLVLIQLPKAEIQTLLTQASDGRCRLNIDIAQQTIAGSPGGSPAIDFDLDPFRKHCFLHGLDDLEYLLSHQSQIAAFEKGAKRFVNVSTTST